MSDRRSLATVAVLVSGGLESTILTVDLLRTHEYVQPIYVRFGLRWESSELEHLRSFLKAVERPGLLGLVLLDEPLADVYGDHWSVAGPKIPMHDSADEAVYLPGRNLLLLTKAAVWCQVQGIKTLAMGITKSNPFPDATAGFFEAMTAALSQGLGGRLCILRPFDRHGKVEVLGVGRELPLGSTFSCLNPDRGRHCGSCNKCAERRQGFRAAAIDDPTDYAHDLLV